MPPRLAGLPIRVAGQAHPPDREYAQRELIRAWPPRTCTYLGAVGTAKKVPLLRDARALLAPITWDEPFGLVLIEAMLSGCPVVAFPPRQRARAGRAGRHGIHRRQREEMAAVIAPGGAVERIDRPTAARARYSGSAGAGWSRATSACTPTCSPRPIGAAVRLIAAA